MTLEQLEQQIPKGGVRTRFAPSPTGYMHVGNLRTALYTYLIAKKLEGTFILRIEDTDQARLVEGACDAIYNTLKTCGLQHDEGPDLGGPVAPYVQSQRREIYKLWAQHLVTKGGAYYCFCQKSEEEPGEEESEGKIISKYDGRCKGLDATQIQENLEQGMPYVIRQWIGAGQTSFSDVVYGEITVDNADLDEGVLLKTDGLPTYNFANVVDDHLMGITHVVRGSEYLSSTPKYNLLYDAFGWQKPTYVHCAPVMRDASHKMSKRHGDPSFEDLCAMGYITPAILNYVALLGWSPGGEVEQFSLEELVEAFAISGISKSPAIFDLEKLRHFNSVYIRDMQAEDFHDLALPYIRQGVKNPAYDTREIAKLLQKRCETLVDIPEKLDFFDVLPNYATELFVNKKSKTDETISKDMLEKVAPILEALANWDEATLHDTLMETAQNLEVKTATLMWPVRTALTGKSVTPGGAMDLLVILGKEESLARIKIGIEKLASC